MLIQKKSTIGKLFAIVATAAVNAAVAGNAAQNPVAVEVRRPVPVVDAKVGGFWHDEYKLLVTKWLPHCIREMEAGGRGEELLNLVATGEVLAGKKPSVKFKGCPWSDAYPYNTIEAICLALEIDPGDDVGFAKGQEFLRAKMEEWIPIILAAQEPSGYIHSYHDLRHEPHFSNAASHEFYVMGYFIEMGIAHYRATKGCDRRLYDAAMRCADHLDSVFGPPPKRTWLNGHPGLEYALCRLADSVNATEGAGKGEKYARLARHFIRNQYRAEGENGKWRKDYHQANLPAWELKDAAGHAVRAVYFYSAMSALASRLGDEELGTAADRLFDSAINRKEYLTGGVGAAWHGEAFAGDYELGNNGYCESCASCGMSFWTIEQHRRKPGTWPVDVQERLVYNNLLGAISEDGEKFFYQNPLDSDKQRYPWHKCPCCVGNVPRTLFALKDNAYSVSADGGTLYADHFMTLEGAVGKVADVEMSISQQTGYPWEGKTTFKLMSDKPVAFTFAVRIPNRIDSVLYTVQPDVRGQFAISVNGEKTDAALSDDGYVRLTRTWKSGDEVVLEFPMPVQRVHCDGRVAANRGLVAFQRGPIVYSFEQVDQKMPLSAVMAAPDDEFSTFWMPGLFGGVVAIRNESGVVAVPNFARLNRAAGRAVVWIAEPKVKEAKEELFPLSRIRLEDGVLKTQQQLNRKYLLRLEPDRLLSRFRREAGLKPKAEPYNGWEAPDRRLDLAGHILGFYMAGAAMTFEATGDEELKRRLEYIVNELEAVQNAQGDGYALAVKDGRKLFAEIASGKIDVKVDPKTEYCAFINGRFEPVYTLNKILIGLYRIYAATGSEKAKRVFLRLSDWFGNSIMEKLNDAQLQKLLACEHGSLPETFADAFLMTGDEKYRRWARRLCHENMLASLAEGRVDRLVFHHANNEIPKFTGFERVYRITGEERLHRSLVNAWNTFTRDHAWANGGNSHREHLFPKAEFQQKLFMDGGPESCNSVNMLRETEALFQTEPSADKMDYYERVLFSHLLSTHEPVLGRTAYYTPVKPGASRTYSGEFESMWCCTGTGFEAPGKYAQMVFTHAPDNRSVSVQLFVSATLDWKERGVKLRQKTDFPYGETSRVTVEAVGKDAKFAIKVRRPAWTKDGFAVSVNGERVNVAADATGYVAIERAWKKGDRIDLSFPMALRAELLPGSKNYAAFFYGPTLLVGDMGSEGVAREDYIAKPPSNPNSSMKLGKPLAMPDVPMSALGNPGGYLKREPGAALAFRLDGSDMRLVPISDLHFRRYTMYWHLVDKATTEALAAADARAAQLHETCIDEVLIGDVESEKAHGLAVERSATGTGLYGDYGQYHWRHALSGGFFAYRLAVGDMPGDRTLVIKYYACERGRRVFDVLVDGTPVCSESLGDTGRPGFVFRETAIPAKLLDGKKTIEVRFVPKPGNTAGGVFGLWLVRPGDGERRICSRISATSRLTAGVERRRGCISRIRTTVSSGPRSTTTSRFSSLKSARRN